MLLRESGGKKVSTKEKRWYKDVGLGFKTPAEAISGNYIGTPRSGRCGVHAPGLTIAGVFAE